MKRTAFIMLSLILAGCEYTVPLAGSPGIPIDRSVLGLWRREAGEGRAEKLLVLPMGDREYLVSYPAGTEEAMFARACLWKGAGITLAQLNWFGTAKADLPNDGKTFQFASYSVESEKLIVRLLNSDVVSKDAASAEALAASILEHRDNPDLFRQEMAFVKAGHSENP